MDFLNNIYQCFIDEKNNFKELLHYIYPRRKRSNTAHKYLHLQLGHNHANERKFIHVLHLWLLPGNNFVLFPA